MFVRVTVCETDGLQGNAAEIHGSLDSRIILSWTAATPVPESITLSGGSGRIANQRQRTGCRCSRSRLKTDCKCGGSLRAATVSGKETRWEANPEPVTLACVTLEG